ncbi:hypothetical protein [Helicobacter sp. 13S00477-4]|uniref:hypothetical protein n=1 Tax=Helicobacter sp. 13S00477-4 TaxID=1905759 RepID=UPI000BA77370|nr:hypothetical protein [Helicobacter sp. 13S00477-4]PAF51288.1 hypothetical protein BKH44_06165 [Helicobacter sp. 13S00477-4]
MQEESIKEPNFTHPLLNELLERAKGALDNEGEVNEALAFKALKDMDEAVGDKKVADYIKLDFAYARLKLYLKIGLNGEDEMLLNKALKVIEKAPYIDDEGLKSSKKLLVLQRKDFL